MSLEKSGITQQKHNLCCEHQYELLMVVTGRFTRELALTKNDSVCLVSEELNE